MTTRAATPDHRPGPRPAATVRAALRRGAEHRRWRRRAADLLEGLAVVSLVGVVVLFLRDGGSADLVGGDLATVLSAVGRVTGLVAVDLLLIQLLLAARVPWVDRAYGIDRALWAHRVLGRVSLPLVLVHVEALVVAYAVRAHLSPWLGWAVEPFRMLSGVPDMLTATVGTLLLVLVAVTSVRAARRRMSYERWHLVHLAAYAGVGLSVPHQLSMGSDLTRSGAAKAYWVALYLLVAVSILWWRLVLPAVRTVRHGLRVESVVEEVPGTWSVRMTGRRLDRLPARAGQFLGWRFLSRGLWTTAHPWSLSAMPDGRHLRITVRDLGDHSSQLAGLRPGTPVAVEGPYGAFTTSVRTHHRVLLVAAGIGVTPVRAVVEELVRHHAAAPGAVTVVVRVDDPDQVPLRAELERLTEAGGHHLLILAGPPVPGSWLPADPPAGSDVRRLGALVPHLRLHDVYVCGPSPWMKLVHRSLRQAGVPAAQVHDERFGW